jgi:hypothetical protein
VERCTVVVRATADDIHHAMTEMRDRWHVRLAVLIYAWGFLLVSIAAFRLRRRRGMVRWLADRERRGQTP